jgi:DNA-binding beta-propeller fold protein YncE
MTIIFGFSKPLFHGAFFILLCVKGLSVYAQMAPAAPAAQASKKHSPIAINVLPSGSVFVLGSHGGLSLIDPATHQRTPMKTSLGNFTPLDMTSVHLGDQDYLLITMYWAFSTQAAQGNEAVLVQYSLQGKEAQKWSTLGHVFAGIAADGTHQCVYLGSTTSGDIWKLSLSGQESPKSIAHTGASMIGPLALDLEGKRLFAADLGAGSIYVIDLAHNKSRSLASGLGEPAALSYDSSQHKLYIADASRHRISQISVDATTPKVSDFFTAPELHEPRGVSVAADHTVWAADFDSGTIIQISGTGKILATVKE